MTVAQEQADFVHYDPLAHLSTSKGNDVHAHPELRRKLYSALAEGDEGELSIAIPENVVRASGRNSLARFGSEGPYLRVITGISYLSYFCSWRYA